MRKIFCSSGALITRKNGRDHRLLAGFAEKLPFDGFELLLYESWYDALDTVVGDIKRMGIDIPVVHCDKQIGELIAREDKAAYELFGINCNAAAELGAGLLVLHLWNGIISDSNFEANLSAFGRLRDMAREYGLLLTAENVVCSRKTPLAHLYELREAYPDIAFTFDTKMAEFHGELEKSLDAELWRNVKHIHVNDYGGGIMDWDNLRVLHIGGGHVDFDGFFDFIRRIGYNGDFTVESTAVREDGSVDFDKLSADFLKIKGYIA